MTPTGWSKETVDCNISLTESIFFKKCTNPIILGKVFLHCLKSGCTAVWIVSLVSLKPVHSVQIGNKKLNQRQMSGWWWRLCSRKSRLSSKQLLAVRWTRHFLNIPPGSLTPAPCKEHRRTREAIFSSSKKLLPKAKTHEWEGVCTLTPWFEPRVASCAVRHKVKQDWKWSLSPPSKQIESFGEFFGFQNFWGLHHWVRHAKCTWSSYEMSKVF